MTESSKRRISADNYFAILPEWVLYAPITPNAKITYAVLQRYANSEGICFPSRATLANRIGVSVRAIDRALGELQDINAVRVQRRKSPEGGWTSSLYHVRTNNVGAADMPLDDLGVVPLVSLPSDADDTRGSAENDTLTRAIINQSQEPYNSPSVSDETGFDEFWATYPRRVGKGQARKMWKQAIKKTDAATIIQGAQRYAEIRSGEEAKYTAYPASWLNGERWTDEPDPTFEKPGQAKARAIAEAIERMNRKEIGA